MSTADRTADDGRPALRLLPDLPASPCLVTEEANVALDVAKALTIAAQRLPMESELRAGLAADAASFRGFAAIRGVR